MWKVIFETQRHRRQPQFSETIHEIYRGNTAKRNRQAKRKIDKQFELVRTYDLSRHWSVSTAVKYTVDYWYIQTPTAIKTIAWQIDSSYLFCYAGRFTSVRNAVKPSERNETRNIETFYA